MAWIKWLTLRELPRSSGSSRTRCALLMLLLGVASAQVCGPNAGGASCAPGECCSEWGFCGSGDPAFCGAGCQWAYGVCDSPTYGGGDYGGYGPHRAYGGEDCGRFHPTKASCASPWCCSAYGFCGTGTLFCGNGCQAGYGDCNNVPTGTASTSASRSYTASATRSASVSKSFVLMPTPTATARPSYAKPGSQCGAQGGWTMCIEPQCCSAVSDSRNTSASHRGPARVPAAVTACLLIPC